MKFAVRLALPLLLVSLLAGQALTPVAQAADTVSRPAAEQALNALLAAEWEWRLREFPEGATAAGDHRYDDRLTDRSPEARVARRAHHARFLTDLKAIDRSALQGEARISFDIFCFDAALDVDEDRLLSEGDAAGAAFSASDSPLALSQMAGPQFDLLELPRTAVFHTVQDYQHYLSRLHALPRALAQQRELMDAGRRTGWILPHDAVIHLPEQFDGLLVGDPEKHPLFAPFVMLPEGIDAATAAALRKDAAQAIRGEVVPAVTALRDYIVTRWLPATTAKTGAPALPHGDDWYRVQLRRFTTTDMSPAEIHALGRKEIARIQDELAQVLKDAHFKGSIADFRNFLLTDRQFQYADAASELQAFRNLSKEIDPQLPVLFAELPRLPYGIRPMHAEEGNNAPHYTPGAIDGTRAGWFEANTNNLAGTPSWSIESLFLHETVPGHHLQTARASELQGLPELRRNYWSSAYGEGWALYSESLGYRLGLYRTPYTRFGRLADESLRAARLVVDTGLHSLGWTRQQAIDYLIEYGQQERGYAEAEVDRYLVWPGQATAYKVGELRILALRDAAQKALADQFDLRRFHNAVLDHGALPLTVLGEVITDWTRSEKSRPPGSAALSGASAGNPALASALDAEWEWRLAQFPEYATRIGDHRFDDRVTDLSPAAVAARRAHHRDWLATLRTFDPATLKGEDRISWDIFSERAGLTVQLDELLMSTAPETQAGQPQAAWSADDRPLALNQMEGPQFDLPQLVRATRFESEADYRNYLARLSALPGWIAQLQAQLESARQAGWMPPQVALSRVPAQFAPLLETRLDRNPLYTPFQDLPARFPVGTRIALQAGADSRLHGLVIPAIQRLRDWLATTWIPAARTDTPATGLPRGAEYYRLALQFANTTRLSPDEIHRLGLQEVARIETQMAQTMGDTGFQGSTAEFRAFLRQDERFRFHSAEDELAAFRDLAKRVDPQLPALFATLPRQPYGVRPMAAEEGNNAPHYVRGALDGSRAGYFEANLNNLAAWPNWTMESLFLHEGVPGHHLQIARASELTELPRLRRSYGNSGFSEGWALYAEGLGKDLGLYTDPYAWYGRLAMEAFRASRLVVDTGLHAQGWTRMQAIDYLVDHGGQDRAFAEAEVDRYLVWPGQATAYKLGELRIRANRERAEKVLGTRFDLRRFHNAVLDHGTLPLTELDQVIDGWISSERSRP